MACSTPLSKRCHLSLKAIVVQQTGVYATKVTGNDYTIAGYGVDTTKRINNFKTILRVKPQSVSTYSIHCHKEYPLEETVIVKSTDKRMQLVYPNDLIEIALYPEIDSNTFEYDNARLIKIIKDGKDN